MRKDYPSRACGCYGRISRPLYIVNSAAIPDLALVSSASLVHAAASSTQGSSKAPPRLLGHVAAVVGLRAVRPREPVKVVRIGHCWHNRKGSRTPASFGGGGRTAGAFGGSPKSAVERRPERQRGRAQFVPAPIRGRSPTTSGAALPQPRSSRLLAACTRAAAESSRWRMIAAR